MRRDPLAFLGTELDSLKQQGLYRRLRVLDGEQAHKSSFDHRQVVNLSSNNYLGLTTHPKLRERALEATRALGVGTGSVRTIAGTMDIHMELERRLAAFKQTEAVVVFQSGFAANAGTVAAVLSKDDVVISDELNHASIIDGARLSRATIKVFPHKDAGAARTILQALPATQRKLLITDGVFSMDGDLGALPDLCALAEEFGCIMMVDDAHASGVFGKNGRGTVDHFGMHGRVDIQVGTLSQAIGVLGVTSAGGGRGVHRGARCAGAGTEDHRATLGQHRVFQSRLENARLQHRAQREPDHTGHRRRWCAGDEAVGSVVRERRLRAGHRVSHRGERQGPRSDHRDSDPHERRAAVRA
jgi:7-keto-8-aminopelargonate synthetase-like enzyme